MSNESCANCGAPKEAGFAACKFCKKPFVENVATQAVPCPKCPTINDWGVQKCASCGAWVVVQCVFCGGLSPHHISACLNCKEPFQGAPERLRQRQQAQQGQRNMQIAGTVGNVAASFIGAAAGAWLGTPSHHSPHWGGSHHHQHHSGGFFSSDGDSGSSFFGSDGSSGSSDYSSDNQGGGIMDALTGGGSSGSSDDSSSSFSSDDNAGGGIMDALSGGSDDS